MSIKNNHEPRILIWFDIKKNKIASTDIPLQEIDFLEREGINHYYTVVHFSSTNKKNLIHIIKHTRGSLVKEYEDEFCCTPPRNKGDTIYVDCNGIKANIYGDE